MMSISGENPGLLVVNAAVSISENGWGGGG